VVERVLHFERGDFVRAGLAHFGFHLRDGSYCAINHQDHFVAMIDPDGAVTFTVAPSSILPGVPNVRAELKYPIYADQLPDGDLIVSNFGNCLLFRVSEGGRRAHVLVSGHALGMADMGNCVVDDAGFIWVNEVTGCRLWRFDAVGHPLETLGDGRPGFQLGAAMFEDARFGSIYDIRRGDDGRIYVLDSGNFAVRVVDPTARNVETLAGTGTPGYEGDGGMPGRQRSEAIPKLVSMGRSRCPSTKREMSTSAIAATPWYGWWTRAPESSPRSPVQRMPTTGSPTIPA
jgi:hypothetical protein